MSCRWCDPPGFWACGEEPPGLCDGPLTPMVRLRYHSGSNWAYVGEVELEEGRTYFLKCRPGGPCDAIVDVDPDPPSPWEVVGEVTIPSEHMPAGIYDVLCKTGFGQKCQVALQLAVEGGEGK